ncbi:hypothetical protein HB364_30180 [Pseudoflavitalea sp. X16]|uniref:hypothetical protein n=1 Tax=Paraflavitalea devenefica TaxID=2716334 RepID=UPI0014230B76|nr:hypothetical protein [Paraflavitalea devenefica]NII29387.1 hypothetical protein [Paraflavitalea devenefica]
MKSNDFYPFMKVFLDDEYGVVIDQFNTIEDTGFKQGASQLYGIIRWDTNCFHTVAVGGR